MRSKKISLVVVPVLLTACSHSDTLVQDVYKNQYDCELDWNAETCEQEQHSSGGGHYYGGYGTGRYLGPQYYEDNRKVSFRGNTLRPRSNLSIGQPMISKTMQRYSASSPIRGGFGRGGSSFGG